MKKLALSLLLPPTLITIITSNFAFAEEKQGIFSLSTGFHYNTGDYNDDEKTDVYYIPLTAKYSQRPWTFKLTIPYISIKGPGATQIIANGSGNSKAYTYSERETFKESGLGDTIASVTYSFDPITPLNLWVELTGKIKIPTADENRYLTTGEFDYSVQLDAMKPIGRFTPFTKIGYKFRGKNSKYTLQNSLYTSLGFSYKLNSSMSGGLIYDYRQPSSETSAEGHEAVAFISNKFNLNWSITGYCLAGFSESSPDYGMGIQLTYKFN